MKNINESKYINKITDLKIAMDCTNDTDKKAYYQEQLDILRKARQILDDEY